MANLSDLLADHGWDAAVVKPTISATAMLTWRTSRAQASDDQGAFEDLLRQSGAMVQPFLEEVASQGEWSVFYFNGTLSHAVIKHPQPGDFRVQSDFGGSSFAASPPYWLLDQVQMLLATIAEPWLYARVDGVARGERFLLMELELIEPSLFLAKDPQAPERFAEAILARMQALR